jgi:hypothetical protein
MVVNLNQGLLDALIKEGRLLRESIAKHFEGSGPDALPPEEQVSVAELNAWYKGISGVLDQRFGGESSEARIWRDGLERIKRESWENVGRVSPSGGHWGIHILVEALGLLAEIRLLQLKPEESTDTSLTLAPAAKAMRQMPHVFLSYVREDQAIVGRLVAQLKHSGVQVWLDREQIKPGQRWQSAIADAIGAGAFFIACFSSAYEKRDRSYMNAELVLAINELRRRPTDRAWFIPVMLTQCSVPDRQIGGGETLRDIQWVDLFEDWDRGLDQLLAVIAPARISSDQVLSDGALPKLREPVEWESWPGTPTSREEFSPKIKAAVDVLVSAACSEVAKVISGGAIPLDEMLTAMRARLRNVEVKVDGDVELTVVDDEGIFVYHPWPAIIGNTVMSQWRQRSGFADWMLGKFEEMGMGYSCWKDNYASDVRVEVEMSTRSGYLRRTVQGFRRIAVCAGTFWTIAVEGHEVAHIGLGRLNWSVREPESEP